MNFYLRIKTVNSSLKNFPYLVIVFFLLGCNVNNNTKKAETGNKTQMFFSIKRGINISHWLSQNPAMQDSIENFFTEKDIIFYQKKVMII